MTLVPHHLKMKVLVIIFCITCLTVSKNLIVETVDIDGQDYNDPYQYNYNYNGGAPPPPPPPAAPAPAARTPRRGRCADPNCEAAAARACRVW